MRSRSPRRRGARLTLTMLIMLATLVLVPSSSSALSWCEEKLAPEPSTTGQGVDALVNNQGVIDRIPPIGSEGLSDKGLYEDYLVSGTTWHVIVESDDCFDEDRTQAWPLLYNTLWGLARGIDMMAIETFRFAVAPPLEELEVVVVDVVEGLRDTIWRPLLPAITILGAVTLAWWGLIRKRAMLTIEGTVWMVAATAVGLWILYAPASFMGMIGDGMAFGENLMTSAVTNTTSDGSDGRCISDSPPVVKGVQEDHRDFVARQQSEYLYETLVCRIWTVGQFGGGPNAEPYVNAYARDVIDAQALTRTESISVGSNVNEDGEDEYYDELVDGENGKKESYQQISDDIRTGQEDGDLAGSTIVWDTFRGSHEQGGQRAMIALVGLATALSAGGLILAASIGLLVVKIGFLLLMLMSPIFLLIGIHPGHGRRVLLRWAELVAGLVLKAGMWMAILLLLVVTFNAILSSVQPYGLALIMIGALVVAVLHYRKDVWEPLTTVSFSGSGGGSAGGGGYSAVRAGLAHGAMRAAGGATRKAGGLGKDLTRVAATGAALGTGVVGAGALVAAKKGYEHMRGKKSEGSSETIRNAFANARNKGGAPDRQGEDAKDRDRLVRQGAGAPRPTTEGSGSARASRISRPESEAPGRVSGTGAGAGGPRGGGGGVRGDRRPEHAPRASSGPKPGGSPKGGGGAKKGGGPKGGPPPRKRHSNPRPAQRRRRGGRGGRR